MQVSVFCLHDLISIYFFCLFDYCRYIKLNGMKFCKEDHLALINLMYELVVMPELELSLVQKFAAMLINLLK